MTNLRRQGFEVYLPVYSKRRSHAGKTDMVAAPLFPRYLFVAIDLDSQRWRSICSTFGVAQMVCRGDRPAPLADEIIAELRSREDEHGLIGLGSVFRPGERVRVVGGAFADHFGMFDSMGVGERVAVLLDLLGRKVRAVMNINVIEAA
jgi:transcriptional antiterminator RfaH